MGWEISEIRIRFRSYTGWGISESAANAVSRYGHHFRADNGCSSPAIGAKTRHRRERDGTRDLVYRFHLHFSDRAQLAIFGNNHQSFFIGSESIAQEQSKSYAVSTGPISFESSLNRSLFVHDWWRFQNESSLSCGWQRLPPVQFDALNRHLIVRWSWCQNHLSRQSCGCQRPLPPA